MPRKGRKNALCIMLAALTLITMLFTSCEEKIPVNLTLASFNEMLGAKSWSGGNYNYMNEAEKAKFREDIKASPDWSEPSEPSGAFTMISKKVEGLTIMQTEDGSWYKLIDGMTIPMAAGDDAFKLPVYLTDFAMTVADRVWTTEPSYAGLSVDEKTRFRLDTGKSGEWNDVSWEEGRFSIRNYAHPDFTVVQEADGTWKSVCRGVETVLAAGDDPWVYPMTYRCFVNGVNARAWTPVPNFNSLGEAEKARFMEDAAEAEEWKLLTDADCFSAESLVHEGFSLRQEADGKWYSIVEGKKRPLAEGNWPFAPLLTFSDFEKVLADAVWERTPNFAAMSAEEREDFQTAAGEKWTLLGEEGVFKVSSAEHEGFALVQELSGRWHSLYDGIRMPLGVRSNPWAMPIFYADFIALIEAPTPDWEGSKAFCDMGEDERTRFKADALADGGKVTLIDQDRGIFSVTHSDHEKYLLLMDGNGWTNCYDGRIEVPIKNGDKAFQRPFLIEDFRKMLETKTWDRERNWTDICASEVRAMENTIDSDQATWKGWYVMDEQECFQIRVLVSDRSEWWYWGQKTDGTWFRTFEDSTIEMKDGEDPFIYPPCWTLFEKIEAASDWENPVNFNTMSEKARKTMSQNSGNDWNWDAAEWTEDGLRMRHEYNDATLLQTPDGKWYAESNGMRVLLKNGDDWDMDLISYQRWSEWIAAKKWNTWLGDKQLTEAVLSDLNTKGAGVWQFSQEKDAEGNFYVKIASLEQPNYTFYWMKPGCYSHFTGTYNHNGKIVEHIFDTDGEDLFFDWMSDLVEEEYYYYYNQEGDYYELKQYRGSDTEIVVPHEFKGKPIKVLHDTFDFYGGNDTITKVTLPDSIIEIGIYTFKGCTELKEVVFSSNVKKIGDYAFYDCKKLTTVGDMSAVTSIGQNAFTYCNALTGLGPLDSLVTIAESGINHCGITGITLPSTLASIGDYAFAGDNGLSEISIPSSVTFVGESAFNSNMTVTVTIGTDISGWNDNWLDSTGSKPVTPVFEEMPADSIFNYKCMGTSFYITELKNPESTDPIVIGEEWIHGAPVNGIRNYAFKNAKTAKITIDSPLLTEVQDSAFGDWSVPMSELIIAKGTDPGLWPKGWLGWSTPTVTDQNDIEGIWRGIVHADGTASLHNLMEDVTGAVEIPATFQGKPVTALRRSLFDNRKKELITSITIPESVTWIGEKTFMSITNLSSLTLSKNVSYVGPDAFWYMPETTTIFVEKGAPIEKWHSGWTYGVDARLMLNWEPGKVFGWQKVDGGAKITSYIGTEGNVTVPAQFDGLTVTAIGQKAFYRNSDIVTVALPSTVTSIGELAFVSCPKLENITGLNPDYYTFQDGLLLNNYKVLAGTNSATRIPENITAIGKEAFKNLTIERLFLHKGITSVDYGAFTGWTDNQVLVAEKGINMDIIDDYESWTVVWWNWENDASEWGWKDFRGGVEISYCGATGTDVTVPSEIGGKKVLRIGNDAFHGQSGRGSVTLPEGLEEIGYRAFLGCTGLSSMELPSSVKKIDGYAFEDCTGIKRLNLPKGCGVSTDAFIGWKSDQIVTSEDTDKIGLDMNWTDTEARIKYAWIPGTEWCAVPLEDGTLSVVGYFGPETETLTVPASLGGKNVTGSSNHFLSDIKGVRTVIFQEPFSHLGQHSFNTAEGERPTTIVFPKSIRLFDTQGQWPEGTVLKFAHTEAEKNTITGNHNITAGNPTVVWGYTAPEPGV